MNGINTVIWHERRIRCMDDLVSPSSSSESTASQLTREQQVLLNMDEVVALWYLGLAIWYGYYRFRNCKGAVLQRRNTYISAIPSAEYEFSPIHWLILSIAMMGLANFLYAFSYLTAMRHRSSIGSTVLKLSYVSMFLSCLRHPCTLSLGVLAPNIALGSARRYYLPSGSAAEGWGSGIKGSCMCLAALACSQLILRLSENLIVLFHYGGRRNSGTVKVADFFGYILDGIFLGWMLYTLYNTTIELSRNEYGRDRWQAWWKSKRLIFFWVLYTVFVAVAAVLVLIGIRSVFIPQKLVYIHYEIHTIDDLLLLTGIAIILRPKAVGNLQIPHNGNTEGDRHEETDYSLLLAEESTFEADGRIGDDDIEEGETIFEMTPSAVADSFGPASTAAVTMMI